MIDNRYKEYHKDAEICWQKEVKQRMESHDAELYSGSPIKISDLRFVYVDKENKYGCDRIKEFIVKYEWLGKLPVWVTHRFAVYFGDLMVCAIVMGTPYTMSNLLGKENANLEKLIARGASNSLAPKNIASWAIMKSIRWMVDNTEFRLFTAYSDPDALELGTVYQACNFYYLGQKYGGTKMYRDPLNPDAGWVGSSYFSQRATIKRVAIENGVEWKPEYIKDNATGRKRVINWEAMTPEVKAFIKQTLKDRREGCEQFVSAKKHKYAYILGQDKRETSSLRNLFKELHPEFAELQYPKERGYRG